MPIDNISRYFPTLELIVKYLVKPPFLNISNYVTYTCITLTGSYVKLTINWINITDDSFINLPLDNINRYFPAVELIIQYLVNLLFFNISECVT